jgi:subtilisin family serine protease
MAAKRRVPRKPRSATTNALQPAASERQLVVVTTESAGLQASPSTISSSRGASVQSLEKLLKQYSAALTPLFGNEERLRRALSNSRAAAPDSTPDLARFYHVNAPDEQLERLAEALLNETVVDGAYIRPPSAPPVLSMAPPSPQEAPPATPNFVTRQIYLDAAPAGIAARHSWTRQGGRGQGVRIIDVEGGWQFSHEDMLQNQGGAIGGTQRADWRNHGTAVVGVIGADENSLGVTGICPEANLRAISIFGTGQSSAKAITDAANALSPGDIILIELHAPGPRFNFAEREDRLGYIAVEFWPEDFAAVLFATSVRGVIVVEAGGNGAENLDDGLYNTRPNGFPTTWRNPFNLGNPQSGAIIVGAGAPPPGTHGRDHGPDRSRLDFSNFGARVDVQGWGREVTTCGYGDLQGGSNEDLWYTDTFSGTSSASPIIVGTVGCLQGVLRARGRPLLTPATARDILRQTGSPQQDAPGRPASQRIGNRPDLFQAFQTLGLGKGLLKETKDKEKSEIKEIKDKDKETIKEIKDKEKSEIKEIKDKDKETVKETKDKEKSEVKEIKDKDKDKENVKETKDKEKAEIKEIKDKDKENVKETKDKEKAEFKEVLDTPSAQPQDVGGRLAQLEQTVASLVHFINAADRPDLQHSALGEEADLASRLGKQAVDAKSSKDQKDVEKAREG